MFLKYHLTVPPLPCGAPPAQAGSPVHDFSDNADDADDETPDQETAHSSIPSEETAPPVPSQPHGRGAARSHQPKPHERAASRAAAHRAWACIDTIPTDALSKHVLAAIRQVAESSLSDAHDRKAILSTSERTAGVLVKSCLLPVTILAHLRWYVTPERCAAQVISTWQSGQVTLTHTIEDVVLGGALSAAKNAWRTWLTRQRQNREASSRLSSSLEWYALIKDVPYQPCIFGMSAMVQEQSSCWDSASALDEPAIAASAEAQVTHAVRRATSAFTAFLHDNFGVIGFVQIPRLVTSLQKSSTTDVCAGIVPLLAHSHEGFVKMPHRRGGAPTLDESMIVPSSRSFYQAQRYVALATQVLAVAFCPEDADDASRTHRTVTTAQFASAFLEHLDARTKVLITAINRAEAAGALDAKRNGPRRFDKDLDLCIDRHLIAALEATIRTPPDVRLAALEKAMFPFFNALFQAAEEADNVRDDTAATDDTSNEGDASDASSSEGASDGDTRRKSAPRDRSNRDRASSGKQPKSKPTSSSLTKQSSGTVMLKRDEIGQPITLSDADLALLADMASADAQQESEELFLVDNGRPRSLAASCRWCTQTEYAELFQSLFRAYPQPPHDQRDHRNAVLQALSEAIQDTSPKLSLAVKVRLLLLCKWHRNPPPGLSMGRSDPAKAAANPAALTAPPGSMSFTAGNGATSLRWRDNRATPAGSSHNNNDANVALAGLTPVPATRNDAARVMAAR